MNKKYMDFVPAKRQAAKPKVARPSVGKTTARPQPAVAKEPLIKQEPRAVYEETTVEEVLTVGADTFSIKNEPEYGVIEDFRPKFVKTEVEKRPLSRSHFAPNANDIGAIKAQKITRRGKVQPVENLVENSVSTVVNIKDDKALKIPKSPFLTQTKVAKRPLSKNVYEKKIEPTSEKSTGPVTIIDKPEKESFIGRIIVIIITIILGAVAGTIAFLLLPK